MSNIQVGITDKFDPEVQAMLLAMYSRSFAPIADRLPDTQESADEHKKKLGKYYVQWGHKSVGQLGSTTVWLEGVSQLAAKAIENHPLFNGQESSTRYINYGTQPSVIPSGLDQDIQHEIDYWQTRWTDFYNKVLPFTVEKLKQDYPFHASYSGDMTEEQAAKNNTIWENTIKARAFDMCRGYLVAGSVTNVGFMGTFDTLNDHFGEMLHHPSSEMREIAESVLTSMKQKYPYGTMELDKLRERYSYVDNEFFYTNGEICRSGHHVIIDNEDLQFKQNDEVHKAHFLARLDRLLAKREKGQRIDRVTASKFMLTMRGYIDFGSYRDLHRHRAGVCDMRILTPEIGIHPYYTENLSNELKAELLNLSADFNTWYTKALSINPSLVYALQYAIPMGYQIHVTYKCDLNQAIYILELRSAKTVHNTLRHLVQDWTQVIRNTYGDMIKIFADMDKDNFTLKRGTQTITEEKTQETENVEQPNN